MVQFILNVIRDRDTIVTGGAYLRFFHKTVHAPVFLYIEWAITIFAIVVCLSLPARAMRPVMHRVYSCNSKWMAYFVSSHWRACFTIFFLSIVGRVALLSIERFPEPAVHDEFSYLLGGDTLAHGRLANAELPSWHHFEPFHVLMEPTYATMYPPGFPMFLALGEKLFGSPRAGLLICAAAAAASLCWMLQTLVPPVWAFAGALLAVVRINWFSYFGNGYWGSPAGMLGGCLLAGSVMRLIRRRAPRASDGIVLGVALFLLMNTRPYEGAAFAAPLVLSMLSKLYRRRSLKTLVCGCIVFLAGTAWTGVYCYKVTGRLMLPEALHEQQWAITPLLLGSRPHYEKKYQFADQTGLYRDYELNSVYLPQSSLRGYLNYLPQKLFNVWHFFFAPSLTLLMLGFIPAVMSPKYRLPLAAAGVLFLALMAQHFMQPQYVAPATGVLYLVLVQGLRWLRAAGRRRALYQRLLGAIALSIMGTLMVRLVVVPTNSWPPSWCSWQREMPGYGAIVKYLQQLPGKQLVFVHYDSRHPWPDSWIDNGAEVASQKVIWARDTEPLESNVPLICAYPGRRLFLLTPPDEGYTGTPERSDSVRISIAEFLKPYHRLETPLCGAVEEP